MREVKIQLQHILRNDQALFLTLDHGLTKGPKKFTEQTINPKNLLKLALEGEYTGVIVTPGIAHKYIHNAYTDLPIIIQVNGTTTLDHINPAYHQFCSVEHAIQLGADAISYTLYDQHNMQPAQFQEFGRVVEQTHQYQLPVIAKIQSANNTPTDTDTLAYYARIALELGADIVQLTYNYDEQGMAWVTKAAGKTKVLIQEPTTNEHELLAHAHTLKQQGTNGLVLADAVWSHPDAFKLARALNGILYHDKSVEEVIHFLE